MKISDRESGKASFAMGAEEARILPKDRPKGLISSRTAAEKKLSPLEQGMIVAEEELNRVPDIREDIVNDLKKRIIAGEYKVSGTEIAEMMLRRRRADRIR